ncbi:MAG: 3-dehydroquinate synthase [Desulfobacteraceae bacterium]|nr:3-dehydroquinate synthase [Desulfobacteraceae bacterium]
MKQLQVGLGDRSYPILIDHGLMADIGPQLKERGIAKRFVVVADDSVAALHSQPLIASLTQVGLNPELLTFPAGEASKNLATIAGLASRLARLGVDRKDGLIALGGGVTGDLTGFLAASYMRGIPFVQVPTTLLAQVDSSVGGKTGVDLPEGKNLVGAFYQPRAVYIDPLALRSLPAAELLNGIAEVIKYGVIRDPGFFAWLEGKRPAILALERETIERMIEICCAIKAEVVADDERESGLRRILNFGHTIGHAVEADSRYRLAHGSAVAIGMVAASQLAVAKGMLAPAEASRITTLIRAFGLPTAIPATAEPADLKAYLRTDKKTVDGRPFFVLPTAIGQVEITDQVSEKQIDQVLTS